MTHTVSSGTPVLARDWIVPGASAAPNGGAGLVAGRRVNTHWAYRRDLEHRVGERTRALQESEQRYRRLLASVTDYVYEVDVREGQAVATRHGPGCEAVTGYTTADYDADKSHLSTSGYVKMRARWVGALRALNVRSER